jgi:hypothetical protein
MSAPSEEKLLMSNLSLKVEHCSDLRPHLKAILDCVKAIHTTLSAVMVDVAAIRRTIFDDPENVGIYRNHLKQTIAAAKPLVEEAMLSYDSLMQQIANSQQWTN